MAAPSGGPPGQARPPRRRLPHYVKDSMPAYSPKHLTDRAHVLAAAVPGTWRISHHTATGQDQLDELTDRIWDLDHVAESLARTPLQHAAVLTRADGAQLAILDQPDGLLVAAVAPRDLPDEAYRGVPEPNGFALRNDALESAQQVTDRLLHRYEASLAQVRTHAASMRTVEADQVVLAWQPDGSLTTSPVGATAAAVLIGHGFVHQGDGVYRLDGDDTAAQARAVRTIGPRLDAHGIQTRLQHRHRPTAPTATPTPTQTAPTAPSRAR